MLLGRARVWLCLLEVLALPAWGAFAQPLSLAATYELRGGRRMPMMGLGVYRAGDETAAAVTQALNLGYRMFDTASSYENEASVGQAIKASSVPRSQLFLATKLAGSGHGFDEAHLAMRRSLRELRVDYVDLYLIESPMTGKLMETWDALVEMRKMGLARSLGVCNFGIAHLEALKSHGRELPEVNQIELHPLNFQERRSLLEWCQQNGILVQAYGSLLAGRQERLKDEAVVAVANAKGRTPAQVLLRWALQLGVQVIPKSVKKARLEENAKIFDFQLAEEEMSHLSSLSGELGVYWQPLDAPLHLGDTTRHMRFHEATREVNLSSHEIPLRSSGPEQEL